MQDPALQNVYMLAQTMQGLGKTFEENRKRDFDYQVDQQLAALQKDPENYKPDATAKGYRPTAYLKAKTLYTDTLLKSEEFKQQQTKTWNDEFNKNYSSFINNVNSAESVALDNPDQATSIYMQSYSDFPNGVTVARNADTGQYDFKNERNGDTWSANVTLDEARQYAQRSIKKEDYAKAYFFTRSQNKEHNLIALSNPDVYTTEDGKKLYVAMPINLNTGEKQIMVSDGASDYRPATPDELVKGGWKLDKNRQAERTAEAKRLKEKQELETEKALGEKYKADARESDSKAGLYNQQAKDDRTDAQQKILIEKIKKFYSYIESKGWDLSKEKYRQRAEQIAQDQGIYDQVFGNESEVGAAALQERNYDAAQEGGAGLDWRYKSNDLRTDFRTPKKPRKKSVDAASAIDEALNN